MATSAVWMMRYLATVVKDKPLVDGESVHLTTCTARVIYVSLGIHTLTCGMLIQNSLFRDMWSFASFVYINVQPEKQFKTTINTARVYTLCHVDA